MTSGKRPSRRTLLGGFLAATGLAGTGIAAKLLPTTGSDDGSLSARERTAPGSQVAIETTFFLDQYTVHTAGAAAERHRGDQSLLRGTLITSAGERAGELFASAVTMPGPVDDRSARTPRMETQNLHLSDGIIVAMGTVFAQADIPNIYTVVGGTGRYAGARGTYQFDDNPLVARPEGRATIVLNLTIEPVDATGSVRRQL
jgi:hypothetical protein